jgi:predicted tellurium resistance membrane protein TerC
MSLLFNPETWISLVTLTGLEIVLGVDNVVVLAILTGTLRPAEARLAKRIGLSLAAALRLLLLSAITWITHLTAPVLTVAGQTLSWRDMIMIGGGLFLIVKATQEIHEEIEGDAPEFHQNAKPAAKFAAVIAQIAALDLIFSLDSIMTAIGLARDIEVMAAAICISVVLMYFAAETVGVFIRQHPTTKMLALCFLILIGIALVADGLGFDIPRGYIYFAMGFAGLVEAFNIWVKRRTALPSSPAESEGARGKGLAAKKHSAARSAAKNKQKPPQQTPAKTNRRRRK